eukprot:TRINITY_DN66422_c9_g3_i1.p1 TRINITY_DN66422_c9_g3~~TRINITY_DN66422_c9_g3_i1.p1  ORF type:complete len:467 (+),score=138.09 TRINITY_DN66422_c9_g3_i1:1-1401(+)
MKPAKQVDDWLIHAAAAAADDHDDVSDGKTEYHWVALSQAPDSKDDRVQSSRIGDCWLLSAMLATDGHSHSHSHSQSHGDNTLFVGGRWVDVNVSDQVLVRSDTGRMALGKTAEAAMLEKRFVAVLGGVHAGFAFEAMHMITGRHAYSVSLDGCEDKHQALLDLWRHRPRPALCLATCSKQKRHAFAVVDVDESRVVLRDPARSETVVEVLSKTWSRIDVCSHTLPRAPQLVSFEAPSSPFEWITFRSTPPKAGGDVMWYLAAASGPDASTPTRFTMFMASSSNSDHDNDSGLIAPRQPTGCAAYSSAPPVRGESISLLVSVPTELHRKAAKLLVNCSVPFKLQCRRPVHHIDAQWIAQCMPRVCQSLVLANHRKCELRVHASEHCRAYVLVNGRRRKSLRVFCTMDRKQARNVSFQYDCVSNGDEPVVVVPPKQSVVWLVCCRRDQRLAWHVPAPSLRSKFIIII